jgi:galactokinase
MIEKLFKDRFGSGGDIHHIRAPGRVNLIGEHTDYNDGFVCPMAIEPHIQIACRKRDDGLVRIASTAFPDDLVEFSLKQKITRDEPSWSNYMRGVAAELIEHGLPLVGMDALYAQTLPVGGGLSSSAAIEIGTGLALLTLAGQNLDRMELALLCQKAEQIYAQVPCGLMDQMIVSTATAGHATLFDCRSHKKKPVPVDPNDVRVVICNSMVKHALTGGEYAERRAQCEAGVAYFQKSNPNIRALRDVTINQLQSAKGKLDETIFRRCRHVITENQRCLDAAAALQEHRYTDAGKLMRQSHASLQRDYEVSIPQLDFLSEAAMQVEGVYGARMTGGGFGGCIVALCKPTAAEPLINHVSTKYKERYKIDAEAFATTATAGASDVD